MKIIINYSDLKAEDKTKIMKRFEDKKPQYLAMPIAQGISLTVGEITSYDNESFYGTLWDLTLRD